MKIDFMFVGILCQYFSSIFEISCVNCVNRISKESNYYAFKNNCNFYNINIGNLYNKIIAYYTNSKYNNLLGVGCLQNSMFFLLNFSKVRTVKIEEFQFFSN